jgi:transposase
VATLSEGHPRKVLASPAQPRPLPPRRQDESGARRSALPGSQSDAARSIQPVLKKSRWLLLKRQQNLSDQQRFRLADLLRYNLTTVRAYLLKEAFQQLWDYDSPVWAGKFLDAWCRQTMHFRALELAQAPCLRRTPS